MTKEQRTIKVLSAQVTELTDKLKQEINSNNYNKGERDRLQKELTDLHETFDLLCVPKKRKGEYHDLSANARLTLFMAMRNNIKVAQPTEED